jgi:hypothetical protein
MFVRRLTNRLRAENWVAISIDLVIVVIGVFLGIQASNWNQARLEKRDINQLLIQLEPELARTLAADVKRRDYYETTHRFASIALAAWSGDPNISDRDFVAAAYQASQITGMQNNSPLTSMLDSEEVHKIDDPGLRSALLRVINFNYEPLSASAMQTRYREDVRQIIPADVQDLVRRDCGDRSLGNGMLGLPRDCRAPIAPSRAAVAAAVLRRHPELAGELQFHLSQASIFVLNTIWLDERIAELQKQLEARLGKPTTRAG